MRYFRHNGILGCGLLAFALTLTGALPGRAQQRLGSDPVDDLLQALKTSTLESERNPDVLGYRRRTVQRRIDALRTLGEMQRALMLSEWRDEDTDERVASVDDGLRKALVKRFQDAVMRVLQNGDTADRLAVIQLLADMGTGDQRGVRQGTARTLAPELIKLIRRVDNPAVRVAAARALGKINPSVARPDTPGAEGVVATLEELLRSRNVEERRAAADALTGMVQVILHLAREGQGQLRVRTSRTELLQVATAVVPAAARGLDDADGEVRNLSVQAIGQSGESLAEVVGKPRPEDFPPPGRRITDTEKRRVGEYAKEVEDEEADLRPLAVELGKAARGVAGRLTDRDTAVRVSAARALEQFAIAYRRLERRADSVPVIEGDMIKEKSETLPLPRRPRAGLPGGVAVASAEGAEAAPPAEARPAGGRGTLAALQDGLADALPELRLALRDPDVHVRLESLEAIELLGVRAAPAVPDLRRALYDRDLFVRWAAARTLGWIGAEQAGVAVPDLARLTADPDLDVRMAALTTLQRFGRESAPALPAIARAASRGEGTVRVAAIYAIEAQGADARPAIPALVGALDTPDARVLSAAAEALGRFGPDAREAIPALRRLLHDPDLNVRQAASDAILSIDRPK